MTDLDWSSRVAAPLQGNLITRDALHFPCPTRSGANHTQVKEAQF